MQGDQGAKDIDSKLLVKQVHGSTNKARNRLESSAGFKRTQDLRNDSQW